MAKPRVFISSTFYDLRQIRVELDKFIEGLGYEPVRNEEGDIPYGKDEALQAYCYKEIANIDVLVSIIGSRYGSAGIIKEKEQEYSVSQLELKTALKEDKQVFVFIDKNVFTEYETYILNKNNENVIYKYVDNVNIYKFIEEIKALPHNNNIKGFETAEDITSYLREQFAGLFKQFMLDNKRVKETLIIRDIENTAKTLRELVDYLKEDSQGKDEEINRIIRINHPMVGRLKELLNIHYNIYIEGKRDLEALLKARGYKFNPIEECWERTFNNELLKLFISEDLFENDKLKYIKASDWSDDFIKLEKAFLQKDDDLPF
ncbi:DUF4062 domain-containing protein [Bacteroides sp. 1001136B_160425_E2]|jgi:hypothetical protein|uniref:DUF4062 domain-containing protein n=1 Tax=Bacteroides sp. 1001136B_160425_E2 TaxID=2787083 RepID=UPI00189F0656|nr:DUF4062 domain-containing protein [Bacteroides sp. 1001136B_160425_E2]